VSELLHAWSPQPLLLALGVAADLAIGDPVYAWHPVRLIGRLLTWLEGRLRGIGLDGYGGGILLFVLLSSIVLVIVTAIFVAANAISLRLAAVLHVFVVYALLALGDLVYHVRRIETAVQRGDLAQAREAVSLLVGRDTDRMDGAACRRAAVESLSENLTDGFTSPVLWYAIGGIPGLVLFKIVSTMDSMVGYKTPHYLKFGWCGARLDDVMNYIPARLTWLLIAAIAAILPRFSGRKAWTVGLQQHALLLGPNSGWSEAGTAGALQRRIVGPIWLKGAMVTDIWIGDASDPPLGDAVDVRRALALAVATGLVTVAAVCVGLLWVA
jgi:adenosylcobinamide-phosphate synthase